MRLVRKSQYSQPNWIEAVKVGTFKFNPCYVLPIILTWVKKSSLATVVQNWSDPKALALWRSPFVEMLIRKHKITETLSLVLRDWIPKHIRESEKWCSMSLNEFVFPKVSVI